MRFHHIALLIIATPSAFGNVPIRPGADRISAAGMEKGTEAEKLWRMANRYVEGDGLQDYARAAQLYFRAANAGYAPAQKDLASLYQQGLGVECDLQEAARWYRRAADQGDAEAQNNLGSLYGSGKGVPRDDAEAVRWYTLAAAQNDPEATSNLGMMYLKGRGVEADQARALQLFRYSAEHGYAGAQNNLALMYGNGMGVAKDYISAYAWLDIAADHLKASASLRDEVGKEMTQDQIAQACRLAEQMRAYIGQAKHDDR